MATRPRASSLNPYATSYVPLSKRQVESKSVKAPQSSIEVDPFGTPDHVFNSSSSYKTNEATDKRMMDEQFDMDLEYLQMIFPGLSIDSVTDVFLANSGDLEATIEMLNHLELHTIDSETLPDSLDVGDFLDSGHQGGFASHKTKNSSNDASASTSNESHQPSLD